MILRINIILQYKLKKNQFNYLKQNKIKECSIFKSKIIYINKTANRKLILNYKMITSTLFIKVLGYKI